METVDHLKSYFRPCCALHLHIRNTGHSARCIREGSTYAKYVVVYSKARSGVRIKPYVDKKKWGSTDATNEDGIPATTIF
jgi:hypothetical protein